MFLSLVAAVSENNVIGKENKLPWELPGDLAWFRAVTKGKPVIMGSTTFDSICQLSGGPLPNRLNIVLTRDQKDFPEEVQGVHSIQEAVEAAKQTGVKETMIIGGGSIYRQFLPIADVMYLTRVHTIITDGDTYFPEFNENEWEIIDRKSFKAKNGNQYPFTIFIYRRRGSQAHVSSLS